MTGRASRPRFAFIFSLPRRVLVYELGIWRSLYFWLFRRPTTHDVDPQAFGYASLLTPILLAFIAVSAIEIPVVHFLLPWEGVRRAFLGLGVWGLVWMLGLLASLRIYPHLVSASGFRARYSFDVDVMIPWEAITEVRARRRSLRSSRKVQFERTETTSILNIAISSTTNVEFVLREPMTVRLPRGSETIAELHVYADEPLTLVEQARVRMLEARRSDVREDDVDALVGKAD